MGISGLFKMFKESIKRTHIEKYSGMKVAIDGHSWIHKIIPSIATELYNNTPTDVHVKMFISRARELISIGITPVFVFDGDPLETKQKTVDERKKRREIVMQEIEDALAKNDLCRARFLMPRCVKVTPYVLHTILLALRKNHIEYFVSPYEADAQLVLLQKIGYVKWILSEDSDLLVYGATGVLFKFNGTHVDEYCVSRLHLSKNPHFWDNILNICILSGCDYLDSLPGVGLATANNVLRKVGTVKKFINHMRINGKSVPADYEEKIEMARTTFQHHIVYNPFTQKREYLNKPEDKCAFPGTLVDLPLVHRDTLGGEICFTRHHVPGSTVDQNSDAALEVDFKRGLERLASQRS